MLQSVHLNHTQHTILYYDLLIGVYFVVFDCSYYTHFDFFLYVITVVLVAAQNSGGALYP